MQEELMRATPSDHPVENLLASLGRFGIRVNGRKLRGFRTIKVLLSSSSLNEFDRLDRSDFVRGAWTREPPLTNEASQLEDA